MTNETKYNRMVRVSGLMELVSEDTTNTNISDHTRYMANKIHDKCIDALESENSTYILRLTETERDHIKSYIHILPWLSDNAIVALRHYGYRGKLPKEYTTF